MRPPRNGPTLRQTRPASSSGLIGVAATEMPPARATSARARFVFIVCWVLDGTRCVGFLKYDQLSAQQRYADGSARRSAALRKAGQLVAQRRCARRGSSSPGEPCSISATESAWQLLPRPRRDEPPRPARALATSWRAYGPLTRPAQRARSGAAAAGRGRGHASAKAVAILTRCSSVAVSTTARAELWPCPRLCSRVRATAAAYERQQPRTSDS